MHEFAIHKKHGSSAQNDLNIHDISLHHSNDHSKSLMKGIDEKDMN